MTNSNPEVKGSLVLHFSGGSNEASRFRGFIHGWENAENDIHAVWLQIELLQAGMGGRVVQCDMSGFLSHAFTKNISHPQKVLAKLGLANAREPNPEPVLVNWQQAAAPA
jgi:hypothetical protein